LLLLLIYYAVSVSFVVFSPIDHRSTQTNSYSGKWVALCSK